MRIPVKQPQGFNQPCPPKEEINKHLKQLYSILFRFSTMNHVTTLCESGEFLCLLSYCFGFPSHDFTFTLVSLLSSPLFPTGS